jgi:hypothetical protein
MSALAWSTPTLAETTKAEQLQAILAKLHRDEWDHFDRLPSEVRSRLADCGCSASTLTRKASQQYQNPSVADYLNCIEEMIARARWLRDYPRRKATAQARADATGKAVAFNGVWLKPTTRIERRI